MIENRPITLKEAAKEYGFTVSTLRAEHAKKRLVIFPLGRRHYTTHADIKQWIELCRDEARGRDFTLIQSENNGLSATERASSALAAANETAMALKRHLPDTLPISTNRNHRARQ